MTLENHCKSPEIEVLEEKIHLISEYQKPYIANLLKRMAHRSDYRQEMKKIKNF
jgi:hypothetical protein